MVLIKLRINQAEKAMVYKSTHTNQSDPPLLYTLLQGRGQKGGSNVVQLNQSEIRRLNETTLEKSLSRLELGLKMCLNWTLQIS